MRKRWIYVNGQAIPAEEYQAQPEAGYYVMGDIDPYKSMADGSMIQGRRQHREHLKEHGLMEVGNEVKHMKPYGRYESPKGLKDTIIESIHRVREQHRGR